MIQNMKKLFYTALAVLFFSFCGHGGRLNADLSLSCAGVFSFTSMEISKDMDAVITAEVPGGVSVFTVTASIPVKLVGMAEQYISIAGNKSDESQLVFDFIQDAKTSSSLKSFAGVAAGAKSVKMDFAKLIDALIGTADVANASRFTFKIHVEDASGSKKDTQVIFRWTSAPSFTLTGDLEYELGSKNTLVLDIEAPGKVEKLTLTFEGPESALSYIKKRTGGAASVDIVANASAADFLGFPTQLADQTKVKLDFASIIKNLEAEVSEASTTTVTVKVDDKLGKSSEMKLYLIKK